MDAFDKVEEQLLAKGYSKEEIPAIMVSLVEQSGVKVTPDLLPDKLQPKAPKPEFGPDRVRPRVRGTRPSTRMPGDPAPRPNFGNNAPRTNAGGATSIPRTNATARPVQPQAPAPKFGTTPATPAVPKGNLFTRLKSLATPQNLVKGIRGVGGALGSLGAQTVGYELATKLAQTMGKPGQSRMSMFGAERGDAPVYNTPWSPNNVADAKASGYVPNKGFLNTVGKTSPQPALQPKSPSLTQQQVNKDNQRYGTTVPAGSFGISQQGRVQASAQRIAKLASGSGLMDPKPPASTAPTPPAPPQKTARQLELDSINADKNLTPMQKWAKANPKLAAAKAERDRTRGTSASTNPMLGGSSKVPGLRSGMPK
tara:strand:- start:298 stop:1401 length:1104 start_codon:yes stop_codon:yes gene_type:complete